MEEVREEVGPNRESRSDGVALGMDGSGSGSGSGDDLREEKSEDEADVEAVTERERKIVNRTERD